MTDNSNAAPEQIWTCSHLGEYGSYYPEAVEAEGEHGGMAVEYIRADLASAQVAAAYEDAADEARSFGGDCVSQWHIGYSAACDDISKAICNLTPDDAKGALDTMLKAERAKTYKAAAKVAERHRAECHGRTPLNPSAAMIDERMGAAADAIYSELFALTQEDGE